MCTYVHVEPTAIYCNCMFYVAYGLPLHASARGSPSGVDVALLSEHVDVTGKKTGLEERVEIRIWHSLLLRAHRAPRSRRELPQKDHPGRLSRRLICGRSRSLDR